MRIPFLLALGMLAVGAGSASGQKASHVPVVFVEGYRTLDSLTRRAAIELRATLATRVAPNRLRVLTTQWIDEQRNMGAPDDFGGAWGWYDVREAGLAYRADAIVDLTAVKHGKQIILRARRIRPPKKGPIVELPIVRAWTLDEAVDILARRLADDSVLTTSNRSSLPVPTCPPC
ncbi:MAG: hypothetical protein JF589_09970 [Gemmatimonadetes bacterium]|nr:hypothetical protein [Gemmatimonadota bacterium]